MRIFSAAGAACVFAVLGCAPWSLSNSNYGRSVSHTGFVSEVVAALFCFGSCSPYTSTSRVRRPYGSPVRLRGLMLIILFNRSDRKAAPISLTPIHEDRSTCHNELAN